MRAWRCGAVATRLVRSGAACRHVRDGSHAGDKVADDTDAASSARVDEVLAALARVSATTTSPHTRAATATKPITAATMTTTSTTNAGASTTTTTTAEAATEGPAAATVTTGARGAASRRARAPTAAGRGARARQRVERIRQHRVTQQARDVADELTLLRAEQQRRGVDVARSVLGPSSAAVVHLSGSELTSEQAPQQLVTLHSDKDGADLGRVPRLTQCGCAAVVSLVGRVTRKPTDDARDVVGVIANAAAQLDAHEVPVAVLEVEYVVPFVPHHVACRVCVCCYGASLSQFARDSVAVGDVVHILGHLLCSAAVTPTSTQSHSTVICVLPVGGNVSVVLTSTKQRSDDGDTVA